MPALSRVIGLATTGFGVAQLVKPDLWVQPTGIGTSGEPATKAWHQSLGARDVVSGLGLLFAPAGPALRAATVFRIVSDLSDAVGFGANAPDAQRRAKSIGATVGFAALSAASLRWAGR